jgi:two-component system NtrC family response regulator
MKIANRYTTLKMLSKSINSTVYKVKDTRANEICALKLLHDTTYLAQFKKEFSILQTITHPNIVKAFDLGSLTDEKSKRYYFTMEYVDGTSFVHFLKNGNIEEFEEKFLEALRVVNFIHEKGFIHCDLKPQNMLVNQEGKVKLVDFGFAQVLQSMVGEDIGGTIGYIAPEVLRGEKPDIRADIYSIGIIGYESLAGERIYRNVKPNTIIETALQSKLQPIAQKNSAVPQYLDEIIMKMISKQRMQRFSTCRTIISAIERKGEHRAGRKYVERVLFSDFIGRKHYLETATGGIEDAKRGQGTILLVEGMPGVGKTRFLKEIEHRLFLEGTAVYYTKITDHTKFNLLWLIEVFEQAGADLKKLREMMERGAIALAGAGRFDFFRQCTEALIEAMGDSLPIFLIDDVDFSDSIMIDFVRYVSGMIETHPFFFALTAEAVPVALASICRDTIYHNVHLMHMQGMNEEENDIFIKNMLGVEGNVGKLSSFLHERTAGNPFFTEELLREIIEKKQLKQMRGNLEYDLVRIKKIRIPKRVDEFVSDRISKISRKEKDVLDLVAIMGDAVPFSWLLSISKKKEADTIRICEYLTQKQFFSSSVPDRIEFTHKIVRDILYKAISSGRRKNIHGKVLSFLRGMEEDYHILYLKAHHAFEAKDAQAKSFSLRLTKEAIGRNDAGVALAAFTWLNGLPRVDVLREIGLEQALKIGTFFSNAGDHAAAIHLYEKLLATLEKKGDRVKVMYYLIIAWSGSKEPAETIQELEELLKERMSRDRRFEILLNLGDFFVRSREYARARKTYQRATELSNKGLKKKRLVGRLHYNLCVLKNIEGNRKEAIAHALEIIDTGKKYDHDYYELLGLQSLGYVEHSHERFRNAMKYHQEALQHLRKNEILSMKLYVLTSLAQIAFLTGDHDRSRGYVHDAMIEAKKLGDRRHLLLLHSLFGKLLAYAGAWDHALQYFAHAIEIAKESGGETAIIENSAEMLKIYALRGVTDEYHALLREVESRKGSLKDEKVYHAVFLAQGMYFYGAGDYRAAVRLFDKVIQGRDPEPAAEHRIPALLFCALCHRRLDAPGDALICVREAKRVMRNTKAEAWKLEARFVELAEVDHKGSHAERKEQLESLLKQTKTVNPLLHARILNGYGDVLIRSFQKTGEERNINEALHVLKEAKRTCEEMKAKPLVNSLNQALVFVYEQIRSRKMSVGKEGRYLEIITKFCDLIKNINNPEQLKSLFVSAAKALTGAERGVFLAFDRERNQLIAAETDVDDATVADAKQFSKSVIKRVRKTKQPLIVHDAVKEGRFRKYESVRINKIRSILCIPVASEDRIFGALYLDSRKMPWLFSKEEKEFFLTLSVFLAESLSRAMDYKRMEDEATKLKQSLRVRFGPENLIGQSEKMQIVFDKIKRFAESNVPVLILGESGTGKEVTARTIHSLSDRQEKNFLVVDCSGLSPTLIESELFGYKKGAFTGAREDKMGLFEAANGGTLFIDEIANASESLQSRLLRFFDSNEVKRIGSTTYTKVDTRIVVATNRDLYERVRAGKFSEDLFYRLSKFIIPLPPLRERKEDIKPLIDYYLDYFNVKHKKSIRGVARDVMDLIMKYNWAGNVRELINEVEKWVFFCNRTVVTREYVSDEIAHLKIAFPPLNKEKNTHMRNYVMKVLSYTGGNVSKAARLLKTDKKTIYRNMKK